MGAPLSALRDNFNDNDIAETTWTPATMGSGAANEVSAQAQFPLPSSVAGTHIGRFTSNHRYTLIGNSGYIQVAQMVSTSVAATAFYQLYFTGANTLQWIQVSGTLTARYTVAGIPVTAYSVAWNLTNYKFLRIRENAGFVEWHSSLDGITWTLRAQIAITVLFPLTDLFVDFGSTCGNIASPGSFIIEQFNSVLPALSSTWYHTRAIWPDENRHNRVSLARGATSNCQAYLVTADDMDVAGNPTGNVRYWSGPAGDGRILTEYSTQAGAELMAVDIPQDGSFDLPERIQGRYFRLYHRTKNAATYDLAQFFPRRLVESDDMRAESVLTLHLGASIVTADKLDVTLTITGRTLQTAYNGPRVVITGNPFGGIIGYDENDTYNSLSGIGTYQVLWDMATGKLYGGEGNVIISITGIEVIAGAGYDSRAAYRIIQVTGEEVGALHGTGTGAVTLKASPEAGAAALNLLSSGVGTNNGVVSLQALNSGRSATILLTAGAATDSIIIDAILITLGSTTTDQIQTPGGLNVGSGVSGAINGAIKAGASITSFDYVASIITDALTTSGSLNLILQHKSSGTPGVAFGIIESRQLETSNHTMENATQLNSVWAVATNGSHRANANHYAYDFNGPRLYMQGSASGTVALIGFLGAAAVARQVVGVAAPAGGVGVAAGAWSTAANRDLAIALINSIRTAGINLGLWA